LKVDIIIKNGKLVSPRGIIEGGLAIDNGIIVSIAKSNNLPQADNEIDAKGKVVLPGILDAHPHTNLPPETPITGTKAAARGGITTILDMPDGPDLMAESPEGFVEKRKFYEKHSYVDFSFHGGCSPGYSTGNLEKMWKLGATGVKFFMTKIGDGEIIDGFKELSNVNGLAIIHAENGDIIKNNINKFREQGRKDYAAHLDSRPCLAEIEAGKRIIYYLKDAKIRGVIAHTSLPETVWNVKKSNIDNLGIYVETCPQYLFLTEDDVKKRGPWVKFSPPPRDKERVNEMWNLLNMGWIDTIASDHVSRTIESKEAGSEDILKAPNGMPGLETMLPLMLNAVNSNRLSLQRLVEVMSENPARIYGIFPRKGVLFPGSDGDIVLVDMKKKTRIRNEDILSVCGWTPYDGIEIQGTPVFSTVRGKIVLKDGEVVGEKGAGTFVPRTG
jgi:dihydroorotase (multifunctional complex type)